MNTKGKYVIAVVALLFIIKSIINYFGIALCTSSCMPEICGVSVAVVIDWVLKLIAVVIVSVTKKEEKYRSTWIASSIFAALPTIFLWIMYCYYDRQLLKQIGVKAFNIISLLLVCCFIISVLVYNGNFMFTEDIHYNEIVNSSTVAVMVTFAWQIFLAVFIAIQLKGVHKLMIVFAILTLLFGYSGLMVLVLCSALSHKQR